MRLRLPIWMRNYLLFFILIPLIHSVSIAQKLPLKSQGPDDGTSHPIKGHNNLRKLAKIYDQQAKGGDSKPKAPGDDAQLRRLYELELLKDPNTGLLPEDIRKKELQFAQRMNKRFANKGARIKTNVIQDWKPRGPYNVGGRTRAIAIDISNENLILAGGVAGGMWRSEDGGLSWRKTTGTNEIQSVTAVVQDPRPGFTNIWYYSTGERIGNSASAGGAFFTGNGIYKSIDGGNTWSVLSSTADNLPQVNSPYDLIFNLAVHPATGHLYAATWFGIRRSTDGGATFTDVLPGGVDNWTDIMITPGGVIYATFESDGVPNKGILRSLDGTTWTNITPTGYPAAGTTTWSRTVMSYNPLNENTVYFYADNGLSNGAAFLWRYRANPVTPVWTNLSANLPAFGGQVGNLNTQGSYNMVIKVHPGDSNTIFIGATNLYRSPNGFTAKAGTAWVGGYSPANNVNIYPNQHPDQHALVFYPSNPLKALSANDGGVQVTNNILGLNVGTYPVQWTSLNNGYLTTQPYVVSFDPKGTGEQLMAGFQDNGSWFTNSGNTSANWTEEFGGDGSYNAFADGGLARYVSSQSGNIFRFNYATANDLADDYVSFTRITPAGATGFGFIAPFVLDPNDDNIMYLPAGRRVWRNSNLDGIPVFSNAPSVKNWTSLANTEVPAGNSITAVAISRLPANKLYFGTNRGLIYRVDNSNLGDQPKVDIATGKGLPVGNINCITIDPANADRVFVVFSNYNILSIFYTENGGATWTNISGNLEEKANGTGSGPSVRWLAVEGNSDRYYVGTSTGLYSTSTLSGTSTIWTQENVAGIGNVVAPMVITREDGLVAVATHGNGLYSARFGVTPLPQPKLKIVNGIDDFEVFTNSPNTIIDISKVFSNSGGDSITYSLINLNPALITATLSGNLLTLSYTPGATGKGTIGLLATAGKESLSEAFEVTVRDIEYVLYNQNTLSGNGRPSQLFKDFGNLLAQSADDFEVPAGQNWLIEKVSAQGSVNGAPLLNATRVIIYKDSLGKPGNEIYNSGVIVPLSGTANPTMDLVLPTKVSITSGKYWISIYVELAYGSGNQWFWKTTSTITGSQAQFKDEGDLFGTGSTNWTNQSDAFGGSQIDMLFTLFGKGTGIPAPAAPTNLDASFAANTKFNLKWTDNSTNELGFIIERSTNGTAFSKRTTVGPNNSSYSDTDVFDPLLTYYYRVAAIGLSDTSAYSNVDSTAIVPQAPKAKLASFVFSSFFVANWEPSVGAKYYELDISSDDFSTFLKGYEGKKITTTTYLVWGTQYNKQYKYRVRAANAGGTSKNSNVITVLPTKNLSLASVCSNDPSTTRRWRITNPNTFDVEVEWSVYKSTQKGKIIAPPGQSYFTTNTIPGPNTTFILWFDDKYLPHLAVKTSGNAKCTGNSAYDLAEGRSIADEEIEAGVPFIIDAWPNPAKEKFNIAVMSPYDDEVEMEIYSVKGDRVYMGKSASNTIVEVDAIHYPAGIYILKAKQLMYNQTIKLIKQ